MAIKITSNKGNGQKWDAHLRWDTGLKWDNSGRVEKISVKITKDKPN